MIYVASSWRNKRYPAVLDALRSAGHDVYDFRHPAPGDHGFSWHECAVNEELVDPKHFRDDVLTRARPRQAFTSDMSALHRAKATVLVLPCGRSAHLELGYAVGAGQSTFVLMDERVDEPELMYLMCSKIVVSVDELITALSGGRP
jgi:hypothetical protein